MVKGTHSKIYASPGAYGVNAFALGTVALPRGATQWQWGLYDTYSNCLIGGNVTVWEAGSYDGSGERADTGQIWETSRWDIPVDYVSAPSRGRAKYSISPLVPCDRNIYLDYLFAGSWAYYR